MYVPVVNVGTTAVLLYPRTGLGNLSTGVTEDRTTWVTINTQTVPSSVPDRLESVALPVLVDPDRKKNTVLAESMIRSLPLMKATWGVPISFPMTYPCLMRSQSGRDIAAYRLLSMRQ